jgi:hypothetical protein
LEGDKERSHQGGEEKEETKLREKREGELVYGKGEGK